MRTRTSFQKRQKEIARAEKQRDKIAKRQQKKLMAKPSGDSSGELDEPNPDEPNEVSDENSEPPRGSEPTP